MSMLHQNGSGCDSANGSFRPEDIDEAAVERGITLNQQRLGFRKALLSYQTFAERVVRGRRSDHLTQPY